MKKLIQPSERSDRARAHHSTPDLSPNSGRLALTATVLALAATACAPVERSAPLPTSEPTPSTTNIVSAYPLLRPLPPATAQAVNACNVPPAFVAGVLHSSAEHLTACAPDNTLPEEIISGQFTDKQTGNRLAVWVMADAQVAADGTPYSMFDTLSHWQFQTPQVGTTTVANQAHPMLGFGSSLEQMATTRIDGLDVSVRVLPPTTGVNTEAFNRLTLTDVEQSLGTVAALVLGTAI